MDTFQRRLMALVALFVLGCGSVYAGSNPDGSDTYAEAVGHCEAYWGIIANDHSGPAWQGSHACIGDPAGAKFIELVFNHTDAAQEYLNGPWPYGGDVTAPNPCSSLAPTKFPTGGSILTGYSMCGSVADPATGGTVQCKINVSPLSPPTANPYSGGMQTFVQATPSGGLCNAGDPPGLKDGSNTPVPPAKAPTPVIPPGDQDPPKLCGGNSCYDPKSNQYCATGDSGQVCVPAPAPGATPDPGGCGTDGSTTVCAGNPEAPKPPPKDVPDPPTQTRGHDDYTNTDPATGANGHTGVGTYSNSGSTGVSSGQASGDKGPAPSSTAGGTSGTGKKDDGTTAGGGGDCANPPHVEGSAALGMVAMQQWRERCQLAGVFGDGRTTPPDRGPVTSADVFEDRTTTGNGTADSANQGHYDAGGMGFASSCPLHDLSVPFIMGATFTVPLSVGCTPGEWIGLLVVAFATFAAWKITAQGLV